MMQRKDDTPREADSFTLLARAGVVCDPDLLPAAIHVLASEAVYGYIRTGGMKHDLVWGDLGVGAGKSKRNFDSSDAYRWAVVIRKPPVRKLRSIYATNFFRERYFEFLRDYLEDWISKERIGRLSQDAGSGLLTWTCDESERARCISTAGGFDNGPARLNARDNKTRI